MVSIIFRNLFSLHNKRRFRANMAHFHAIITHFHQTIEQAIINKEEGEHEEEVEHEEEEEEETNFDSNQCKANEYIKILDEKIYEELKIIDEVALSASGRFLKVSIDNKICALKIMNHKKNSPNNFSDIQNFVKEYEFLYSLNHPYILKTFGIFFGNESKPPAILLEFCQMDLEELMKSKALSKFEIVSIIYQIIEAMKYINFRKIIHLNLKPSNILIKNNTRIKIGDFRLSQSTNEDYQIK